jgi:hypothetical protein
MIHTKQCADFAASEVLGGDCHPAVVFTLSRGVWIAFFRGFCSSHCPGWGQLNLPRPGVYDRNAVEP